MGDGVTDLHFDGPLDARNDVAHIPGTDLPGRLKFHLEHPDFFCIVFHTGRNELDLVSGGYGPVQDLEIRDDAAELVEYGVENQRLERCLRVAFRGGNPLHDRIQDRRDALSRTGGDLEYVFVAAAEQVDDLVGNHLDLGGFHIYLVKDRDDLETVVDRQVEVRNGLGLDTLGGIHDQQGPFAGCDRPGDLIGKVHMAGSVDQVEHVRLTFVGIFHLDSMALDGDSLLLLEVHVIQDLRLHVA